MSAADSTNELCRALSPLLLRHEVRLAILFGSRANGKATPTSDVDLALDADEISTWATTARSSGP
jgi:predicted nucleotidyltransferase